MKHLLLFITLLLCAKISVAQTVTGKPTKNGNYKTYITKHQDTIKVGDKIELGIPYNGNSYAFITQGNQPAAVHISGNTATISKLKAIGKAETGYNMYALIKGYGLLPVHIKLDNALKTEEIILLK